MTTNIIPMPRPMNDMDTMVRLCNSPRQQQRRQQKRIQHRRSVRVRMMALHTFLVSAGTVFGFVLGVVIF